MDKELIKNNLLEHAEKTINNGSLDEFVRNNFKFALNRNRIITFFLNNESKNAEINNILSVFIKELKYSQYYFKEMLFDQELKIKLIELFLARLRFLKEKLKIEYVNKNKEKAREYHQRNKERIKKYREEYYQKNKDRFEKYLNKAQDEIKKKEEEKPNVNKNKRTEYQKEYYERNKEKLKEQRKEYHQNNIEKSKEYQKKYRDKNKENLAKIIKEFEENK